MGFLKRLLRLETTDERINRLAEQSMELGWTNADCRRKIAMFTEIIALADRAREPVNVGGFFQNRALCHRELGDPREALEDLERAMSFFRSHGLDAKAAKCREIMRELQTGRS